MDTQLGYDRWCGATAYDRDGDKIGKVSNIFYDDMTRRPEWVAVDTGLFGTKHTFAPLAGAEIRRDDDGDERLVLAVTKEQIKGAPAYDADMHLAPVQEQELYSHYGFDWNQDAEAGHYGYGDSGRAQRFDTDYQTGWREEWLRGTHGRDDGGDVVAEETIHNEEAVVREQPRTVRLRKYQWTEQVPVQREEVRVEQDAGDQTARHA